MKLQNYKSFCSKNEIFVTKDFSLKLASERHYEVLTVEFSLWSSVIVEFLTVEFH